MKEGLVKLPEGLVILGGASTLPLSLCKELPLSEIPDRAAPGLKKGINFVAAELKKGNSKAESFGSFNTQADGWGHNVPYQVIAKKEFESARHRS